MVKSTPGGNGALPRPASADASTSPIAWASPADTPASVKLPSARNSTGHPRPPQTRRGLPDARHHEEHDTSRPSSGITQAKLADQPGNRGGSNRVKEMRGAMRQTDEADGVRILALGDRADMPAVVVVMAHLRHGPRGAFTIVCQLLSQTCQTTTGFREGHGRRARPVRCPMGSLTPHLFMPDRTAPQRQGTATGGRHAGDAAQPPWAQVAISTTGVIRLTVDRTYIDAAFAGTVDSTGRGARRDHGGGSRPAQKVNFYQPRGRCGPGALGHPTPAGPKQAAWRQCRVLEVSTVARPGARDAHRTRWRDTAPTPAELAARAPSECADPQRTGLVQTL